MADTVQIYVVTVPLIEGGKPSLLLVVGLPVTEEGRLLPCLVNPDTQFLGYSLISTWGYQNPNPPFNTEVPQDAVARWYWEKFNLDRWDEIPTIVDETLDELHKVLQNYRQLASTKPAREVRIITL